MKLLAATGALLALVALSIFFFLAPKSISVAPWIKQKPKIEGAIDEGIARYSRGCHKFKLGDQERFKLFDEVDGKAIDGSAVQYTLISLRCETHSDSTSSVFFVVSEFGDLMLATFAEPTYRILYDAIATPRSVRSIGVTGYTSRMHLQNAEFDQKTKTISASTRAYASDEIEIQSTHRWNGSRFVLIRFEVDPTRDKKANLFLVTDFERPAK